MMTSFASPRNVVDLTQDSSHFGIVDESFDVEEDVEEESSTVSQHVASCTLTIVGIRYYTGTAHPGEYVKLNREPQNPYDANAIRVDNCRGEKVGHIKREQALALAKFMDRAESSGLRLEGTIPSRGNVFQLPLHVDFYAIGTSGLEAASRAEVLVYELSRSLKYFHFRPAGLPIEATINIADDAAVAPPKVQSKVMDWQAQAKELDEMFEKQCAEQLLNIPNIAIPGALKTQLLDHQRDGLRWMVHQEQENRKVPFFKQVTEKKKKMWLCEITNCSQSAAPKSIRGGILADEMGLGKTLQIIALLLTAPACRSTQSEKCTLVVCPVSVISNWNQQIETHVQPETLKIGIYQGSNRSQLLKVVRDGNIDILLVSYHTLAKEFITSVGKRTSLTQPAPSKRSKKESVFDLKFHRIVLDEAHMIRSSKTSFFQAVQHVQAERRWVLTGTPFVNRADDVHSLLAFLRVDPLADKDIYRRAITTPIQNGDDLGLSRLRAAMAHLALRRSKASVNIGLVEKTVHLTSVSFEDGSAHKTLYDAMYGSFRMAFEAMLQDGESEILKNYSNVFEKLLRIRQACCSARLVPPERRERAIEIWNELEKCKNGTSKLTAQEGRELLEKLKGTFATDENEELPECAICLMEMEEQQCVILKQCSHVYCDECISRVISTSSSRTVCPLCRSPFRREDLIKKSAAALAATQGEESSPMVSMDDKRIGVSPKILALLECIQSMKPDEKGVIFSQFTSFLDLIQAALKETGHSFTRLDGSMTAAKRMEAVRMFSSDDKDSPKLILCSLHAAGTGINLTRANHCFMMDCWWNQAVENQAMDRVHRIGQTRKVQIVRFVMKDSLEERIVELQEIKNLQAKGSMQKLKADEQRKARLSGLKSLLSLEEK